MKVYWLRLFVLLLSLAVVGAGVALLLHGHPITGVLVGWVGITTFFFVCNHAFWSNVKAKEADAKKAEAASNCGRPECSRCTKCTCRQVDDTDSQSPQNGC